jgi:hypothetical protein
MSAIRPIRLFALAALLAAPAAYAGDARGDAANGMPHPSHDQPRGPTRAAAWTLRA